MEIDKAPVIEEPKSIIDESVKGTPRKRIRAAVKKADLNQTITTETKLVVEKIDDNIDVADKTSKDALKRKGRSVSRRKGVEELAEPVANEISPAFDIDCDTASVDSGQLEEDNKQAPTKLGRRNAFQKTEQEKPETQSRSKRKQTKIDISDDKESLSTVSVVVESVSEQTAAAVLERDADKDAAGKKAGSRIPKVRRPFVVERDDVGAPVEKIPGLAMLQSVKARKSGLVLPHKPDPEPVQVAESSGAIVPGLAMLQGVKARKSGLVQPHKPDPEPVQDAESSDAVAPGLAMLQGVRSRKSGLTQVADPPSNPAPVPTPKPAAKQTIPATTGVIPGLRMTADIRRRKSELLAPTATPSTATATPIRPQPDSSVSQSKKSLPAASTTNGNGDAVTQPSLVTQSKPTQSRVSKATTREELKKSLLPASDVTTSNGDQTKASDIIDQPMATKKSLSRATAATVTIDNKPTTREEPKKRQPIARSTTPASEIIPGLSALNQLRAAPGTATSGSNSSSYRRASIHQAGSDIVPGLSATNELRKQKISAATTSQGQRATVPPPTATPVTPVKTAPTQQPMSVPVATPVRQPMTVAACATEKSQFVPSALRQTPIGILSKPSPYKRPMSCLDDADNGCGAPNAAKMSRIDPASSSLSSFSVQHTPRPLEKRQSVTFNRAVEVKEIHGNSFNSVTSDDGDVDMVDVRQQQPMATRPLFETRPEDQAEVSAFQQQLSAELERTRNRIVDKRGRSAISQSFAGGQSLFSRQRQQQQYGSLPKKTSGLSQMIAARALENRGGGGGALGKMAGGVAAAAGGAAGSDRWRSFQYAPPAPAAPAAVSPADDSMTSQDSDTGKSKCALM